MRRLVRFAHKEPAIRVRPAPIITGLLCAFAIFAWFATPGLRFYFDTDDVMNLRKAWPEPLSHWLGQCFWFAADTYRPLGLAFYKIFFSFFGLRPIPYHLACLALLACNVFLLFLFGRRVAGSAAAGAIAAVIGGFHGQMDSLYFSVGNIYDIACYTLFVSAFLCYLRLRDRFQPSLALLLILIQVLALDMKEMAAMLPLVLLCWELMAPANRNSRLPRWATLTAIWIVTAAFMLPKLLSQSPLTVGYRPSYSLNYILQTWAYYESLLFYLPHPMPVWMAMLSLAAMAAISVALRSRALLFCCCFLAITALPVLVIPERGLNVWYIPMAGWAVWLATLITRIRPNSTVTVLATAALMLWIDAAHSPWGSNANAAKDQSIKTFQNEFAALVHNPPPQATYLFLDDPFDATEWTPKSMLELVYRNPDMTIHRLKMPEMKAAIESTPNYDYVLDYRDQHLVLTGLHTRPGHIATEN